MLFNRFVNLDSSEVVLNVGVELFDCVGKCKNFLDCKYNIILNKDDKEFSLRGEIDLFFSYIRSIARFNKVLPDLIDYNKLIVSKNGLDYIFSYFAGKVPYTFCLDFKCICELRQKEMAIRNYTTMWHLDTIRKIVVFLLNEYKESIFAFKSIDFLTDNIYERDIVYEIILNGEDYRDILKHRTNGFFR